MTAETSLAQRLPYELESPLELLSTASPVGKVALGAVTYSPNSKVALGDANDNVDAVVW